MEQTDENKKIIGYLAPDILLRLLVNRRDRARSEKLLKRASEGELHLATSLFALFEAVASVEKTDNFDTDMLMKILQNVKISTEFEKELLPAYKAFNDNRKMRIRSIATGMEGGDVIRESR